MATSFPTGGRGSSQRNVHDPRGIDVDAVHIPNDAVLIYFDLETTGLGRDSHITQIAALRNDGTSVPFSRYVLPKKPIETGAEKLTGISCNLGARQMYKDGEAVPSVSIRKALEEFLAYLRGEGKAHPLHSYFASSGGSLCQFTPSSFPSSSSKVILLGHNAKSFDCLVLLNAVRACDTMPRFQKALLGFVDTLPLMREAHPNLKSHSLENLYHHFLQHGGPASQLHDAKADVTALREVITRSKVMTSSGLSLEMLSRHSFTVGHVLQKLSYS